MVTYPNISPKMVNPRLKLGKAEEEEPTAKRSSRMFACQLTVQENVCLSVPTVQQDVCLSVPTVQQNVCLSAHSPTECLSVSPHSPKECLPVSPHSPTECLPVSPQSNRMFACQSPQSNRMFACQSPQSNWMFACQPTVQQDVCLSAHTHGLKCNTLNLGAIPSLYLGSQHSHLNPLAITMVRWDQHSLSLSLSLSLSHRFEMTVRVGWALNTNN